MAGHGAGAQRVLATPPNVDCICTATASADAIFDRETTEHILATGDPNRPLLFVDLAIPRDVADDVSESLNVHVCHLGTLRDLSMKNRRERFKAADAHVKSSARKSDGSTRTLSKSRSHRCSTKTQRQADEFAAAGLEGLFTGKLAHLEEADKEAIRYWVMNKTRAAGIAYAGQTHRRLRRPAALVQRRTERLQRRHTGARPEAVAPKC